MKHLRTYMVLCLILMRMLGYGQQDASLSQYPFNLNATNPAYSALRNQTDISLNTRFQWGSFEGGPQTNVLSATTSILRERGGLGTLISTDKIGPIRTTEAHFSYAYKAEMGNTVLTLGLQTGLISASYDPESLNLRVFDDPYFPTTSTQMTRLSFGAGAFLKGDNFMVGLSIPKALNSSLANENMLGIEYKRHLYFTGAYLFEINNGWMIKPMVMTRAVKGAPLSVNFNTSAVINNRYWVGLFTTNLKTFGSMFQLELDSRYKLGYSFEILSHPEISTRLSTHELFLSVSLELLKNQSIFQHYF